MMASDALIIEGDSADPLTPIEQMILDYLLQKARAVAVTEEKATCSGVKVKNTTEARRPLATSTPTGKDRDSSKEQKSQSPPKVKGKTSPAQEKASFSTGLSGKTSSNVLQDFDDFSDDPLDDEQLDQLMHEFGEEMSESEEEGWSEVAPAPARGRRGAPNRSGGRGRGRGNQNQMRTWSDIEESSDAEGDHSDRYYEDGMENDPAALGAMFMQKINDVQLIEYMNRYKKEKKLGAKASVDAESNDFYAWLGRKMQPNVIMSSFSFPPTKTQGKKVVFEEPENIDKPSRGSRGGRRGR